MEFHQIMACFGAASIFYPKDAIASFAPYRLPFGIETVSYWQK
jgi:hypothetical protein